MEHRPTYHARRVALALVATAATLSTTNAVSARAHSAGTDPCSYITDAAASAAFGASARHAQLSNDLCVYYRAPRPSGHLAFVYVVIGKAAASARFAKFRALAGNGSHAITGLGDAAYSIGSNVVTLRGDTLIVVGLGNPSASQVTRRTAAIELARGAADRAAGG